MSSAGHVYTSVHVTIIIKKKRSWIWKEVAGQKKNWIEGTNDVNTVLMCEIS